MRPVAHGAVIDGIVILPSKPFEVMMADNKDFPCEQRDGYKLAFLLIDVKTQKKFVIKLKRKLH